MATTSLDTASQATGPLDRAHLLSVNVGDWVYSYPIAAPETFGFLIGHLSRARNADDLMLGVYAQPRNAATLPALAGAAASIVFGTDWIPQNFDVDTLQLTGISIPAMAGLSVEQAITKETL